MRRFMVCQGYTGCCIRHFCFAAHEQACYQMSNDQAYHGSYELIPGSNCKANQQRPASQGSRREDDNRKQHSFIGGYETDHEKHAHQPKHSSRAAPYVAPIHANEQRPRVGNREAVPAFCPLVPPQAVTIASEAPRHINRVTRCDAGEHSLDSHIRVIQADFITCAPIPEYEIHTVRAELNNLATVTVVDGYDGRQPASGRTCDELQLNWMVLQQLPYTVTWLHGDRR